MLNIHPDKNSTTTKGRQHTLRCLVSYRERPNSILAATTQNIQTLQ